MIHSVILDMHHNKIPLVIVLYTFSDGIEVPIKVAPHGNSTKNKQPFLRTQCSTLESIKEISLVCRLAS